jgi:hypothetical protein
MRQSVSNAQGADVMVLSKRMNENLFLDLYQAKHYTRLPGADSQSVQAAFASLGVSYKTHTTLFDTTPKVGTAAYSYLGTQKLVHQLSETFGKKVEIRNRVVVFSSPKKAFRQADSWQSFPWENARKKNVWIWWREMLEPTISALSPSQPRLD